MTDIDTTASGRAHLKAALVSLGLYALIHHHSWFWPPALTRIIDQKGLRHA